MCLIEEGIGVGKDCQSHTLPILRKAFKKFFIYGVGIQSSLLAEDY